uniref:Transcriptional regulator, XRE family n=1 Tax=Solibacter usitatus (strain Ellin6076) TaxID=234267 RepID=Q01WL9_SOLUE
MDVPLIIRHRLKELGLEQKDLAAAAQVTESYISQLLAGKKVPPAPDRTDIYEKLGEFLELPAGELSKVASLQRREELKKKVLDPPSPLFRDFRALILRKSNPQTRKKIQSVFEKEPFGFPERLVTQKLLEVAKAVAREELDNEKWLRLMGRLTKRSYEVARVSILEFLDTDVFHVSVENCVAFLDPLIESWDIDLESFDVDIVLNRRLTSTPIKSFVFVERQIEAGYDHQPGFDAFLKDSSLSGEASVEELDFLRSLRFKGRKPTPLYYYRELQNLRDPLHFRD